MTIATPGRLSARERLINTADRLFSAEGVHSVGIDRIIEESGVAKGSLYYNFSGKDQLVSAYFLGQHEQWVRRLEAAAARGQDARSSIIAIFDELALLLEAPDYRGCAINHASADAQPGDPEDLAVRRFRPWLRTLLASLVADLGADDPELLIFQLILIFDGASIAADSDCKFSAGPAAKAAVETILPRPA